MYLFKSQFLASLARNPLDLFKQPNDIELTQ